MSAAGALVDIAIAVTVAELIALVVLHRTTGRGIAPGRLLPNVAAGLFLMLALRAFMHDAGWPWLAACLTAAGAAHLIDLARRWES